MVDIIVGLIILIILACAAAYIIKAKKSGVKCIGCPAAGKCCKNHSNTSCGCHKN